MDPNTELAPPSSEGRFPARQRSRVAWLAAVVILLGMAIFAPQLLEAWKEVARTLTNPEEFRNWVEGFGALGPLAFFVAQVLQVMFAPIPGTLFPPVGSLAFGPWAALALSLAGMALGSAIVFLAARRWGRPLAIRLAGEPRVRRYGNLLAARGGLLLWLVLLLPLLPDDVVCLVAGISPISFRRFIVIATLGRLPAVAVGVFTMAGLEGSPAWVWGLAVGAFVLILWLGFRYGPALEMALTRRARRRR